MGDALKIMETSLTAPGAILFTTTEVEPVSEVKMGLFSTSSDYSVNMMLLAFTPVEAFFMRILSSKGCPA